MKKMNNKGFSLVELIIVIAIMAILAAALAPQLIKYLEESRESTDQSACDTIKSCFNAAMTNEAAYKAITDGTVSSGFTFGVASDINTGSTDLDNELKSSLADLAAPKATGKSQYKVEWQIDGTTVTDITVTTV